MTLAYKTQEISAERIFLRRILPSDLDYFVRIHSDPEVAKYIGAGNPRPKAETEHWLDDILESYERANLGQLAVVRKSDGVLLGRCGLSDAAIEKTRLPSKMRKGWFFSPQVPAGTDVELLPELGYTFGRDSWGQGYASEAARCVYQYAKSSLNFTSVMSVIHTDNKASLAVAKKFGVHFIDKVELAGRSFDRYHWQMTEGQLL